MRTPLIPQDKEYLLNNYSSLSSSLKNLLAEINKQIKVINKTNWINKDTIELKRLKVIRNNVTLLCNKCKLQYEEIAFTDVDIDVFTGEYATLKKAYMTVTIEYT
jgi:hypothetical protein